MWGRAQLKLPILARPVLRGPPAGEKALGLREIKHRHKHTSVTQCVRVYFYFFLRQFWGLRSTNMYHQLVCILSFASL